MILSLLQTDFSIDNITSLFFFGCKSSSFFFLSQVLFSLTKDKSSIYGGCKLLEVEVRSILCAK